MRNMLIVATAMVVGAGCATTPVPADKLASSQASVKSAEEMNAQGEPRAALHLKLAKEQLSQAKDLMKEGENDKARAVLTRAEADGEAALNIARAKSAQIEAAKTIESIQQAKTQIASEGPKS